MPTLIQGFLKTGGLAMKTNRRGLESSSGATLEPPATQALEQLQVAIRMRDGEAHGAAAKPKPV